ncbi:NADP-dependent oxidoreductase [Streptomyces sp. NPDC048278]|uniref:NADP-dependent oxidoreductase n=1 Tax=unclassified Streptomyces TaxID=2593676 RepID=UPI00343B3BCE
MRALHVPAAGEQPVLAELPVPAVPDGHVLIKVKAAALNAIDNVLAAGFMAEMMPHEYPLVLGRDAAGVVEQTGAGVSHVAPGDEVIGHIPLVPPIQTGVLAEYAVLPGTNVSAKPANLDFVTAAALPLAGAAALAAVDAVAPEPGQVVLVNGATGGVGSYAVQLLTARGATVVATGLAADTDRLTRLGAAVVVDFTAGSVADQVKAHHPEGVDALVNLVGNSIDEVPLAAVRANGKVGSTTLHPDADALAAAGLTGTTVFATPSADTIAPLAEQAAAGTLIVEVGTVLPLDRATDGLATIAAGKASGKIVVTIGE